MKGIYNNISGTTATELLNKGYLSYPSASLESIKLCNTHASDDCSVDLYLHNKVYSHVSMDGTGSIINTNTNPPSKLVENTDWTVDSDITTYKYYIIKNLVIPSGVTVQLDENDLKFENKYYDLYIQLGDSGSTVDVIMYTRLGANVTRTIKGY